MRDESATQVSSSKRASHSKRARKTTLSLSSRLSLSLLCRPMREISLHAHARKVEPQVSPRNNHFSPVPSFRERERERDGSNTKSLSFLACSYTYNLFLLSPLRTSKHSVKDRLKTICPERYWIEEKTALSELINSDGLFSFYGEE